ncbi:STX4 protein, partial [Struthidea cinerea]|nr:STX4 protein [Struthidea cinerea]
VGEKNQKWEKGTQNWDFRTQNWGSRTRNWGFWARNGGISQQASDSDSDSEGGEGRLRSPSDPVLAQARQVRAGLRALELKLAALEQQQELVLGCPLPPQELQRDLQQLRDEIQELTREIRGALRGLEPAKEDAENPNSIGARLRRTQHGVLSQQFWGVTGRLQAAQARYRQRSLDRIRRQLHI